MKTKTKARILSGLMAVSVLAPAGLAAVSVASCKEVPDPIPEVKFGSTVINVDYGDLTRDKIDIINPKLVSAMQMIWANEPSRGKMNDMLNLPGFKIVIVPGSNGSGCARVGNTMTLGADFLINSEATVIRSEINSKVVINDMFAMIITPAYIARANSGNQRLS